MADSGLSRRGSNPKDINLLPGHFFSKNALKNLYSEPKQLGLSNTWEVLSSYKLHLWYKVLVYPLCEYAFQRFSGLSLSFDQNGQRVFQNDTIL